MTFELDNLVPPNQEVEADRNHLFRVLVNLLRNAADASLTTGGGVQIGWTRNGSHIEVAIDDDARGRIRFAHRCLRR